MASCNDEVQPFMSIPLVERTGSAVLPAVQRAEAIGEKARAKTLFGILLRDVMMAQGVQSSLGTSHSPTEGIESFRTIMALEMTRSLLHAVTGEKGEASGNVNLQAATETVPVSSGERKPSKNRQPPLHVDGTAKSSYDGIIESAATAHEVDPALVRAVIRVESNFEAQSTSPKGAMGLMQLMPGTARDPTARKIYRNLFMADFLLKKSDRNNKGIAQ